MSLNVCLAALLVCCADVDQERAIQIANEFRAFGASFGGPPPAKDIVRCYKEGRVYKIEYSDITATWVNIETGRVVASALLPKVVSQVWDNARALSTSQALQRCQEYFEKAGCVETLQLLKVEKNFDPRANSEWDVYAVPVHDGVPYHYDHMSLFMIAYDTGRLYDMMIRYLPLPPPNLKPFLAADQAEAIALEFWYQNWRFQELKALEAMHLCIWKPRQWAESKVALPESYRQRAMRNEGVLVYAGRYVAPWFTEDRGPWDPLYDVVVDAMTGEVLSARGAPPSLGGSKSQMPQPISWDWGPGEITVYTKGRRPIRLGKVDITRVRPAAKPASGMRMILKRARLTVAVVFDPRSGLLWSDQVQRRYG